MAWMRVVALLALAGVPARAERRIGWRDISTPMPAPPGSVIVVGFLGAWEVWDNPKRSPRKLALKLREQNLPGVYIETAGNHSRATMRRFLLRALDQNGNGRIDADERGQVGVILYGHSMGGAAAVMLARELNRWQAPVLLTVQVDSVGRRDDVIPPNVARALNLYQHDLGSIWGEASIRAADPRRTEILGNRRFTYTSRDDIDLSDFPALIRRFHNSHVKMYADPEVWAIVERQIRAEVERWRASNAPRPSGRAETSRP